MAKSTKRRVQKKTRVIVRRPAPKRAKARARRAAPKTSRSAAAKVAEQARPGWSAVAAAPTAADAAADRVAPDTSVPELDRLKQKYFGADGAANGVYTPTNDAEIVTMEPSGPAADRRAGRKATIVQKKRVIGVQG
jgi:hypothetical protein